MRRPTLSVFLWAAVLTMPLAACANPGDLDPSFGTGGKVTTPSGSNGYINALVLQPDGKLVAAGSTSTGSWAFALVRYTADGSLDGSFGTGGTVTTQIGSSNLAYALVLQPDGKLVAAGSTNNGSRDFALV